MEEQEIEIIVLSVDGDALLPIKKCEIVPQLRNELLQLGNNGRL